MAQDWYYQLLGEETGPISFESLQDLVREGHLNADDEVRSSDSGWSRAADVPDLFATGTIPEPAEATDNDLDLLLSTSTDSPVRRTSSRRGLEHAKAAAIKNAEEWFFQLFEQEVGPVSFFDIIEQIQLGSLQGDDQVRFGHDGKWQPLASYAQYADALSKMQPKPEWYCRILGQVLGPMEFDELQHMAESNSLNPDDEVQLGQGGNWEQARQIRGLKFPRPTAVPAKSGTSLSTHAPFGEAAKRKEWYYEILGQQLGPISFQELTRAVADGSLQLEDKVRRGTTTAWGLVLDAPGLVSVEQKAAYLAAKQEATRPKPAPPTPTPAAASGVPHPQVQAVPILAVKPAAVPPPPPPLPAPLPASTAPVPTAAPPASRTPVTSPPPSAPVRPPSPPMGGGLPVASSRPASLPPKFGPPAKGGKSGGGLKFNGKIVGAIAGVLLIGAAIYGLTLLGIGLGGQPGLAEYQRVKVIWADVQKVHDGGAGNTGWNQVRNKYAQEVKKLEKEITDQEPGASKRLLQLMYFCTHNHLPAIMADGNELRYKAMEKDMKEAEKLAGATK